MARFSCLPITLVKPYGDMEGYMESDIGDHTENFCTERGWKKYFKSFDMQPYLLSLLKTSKKAIKIHRSLYISY